MKRWLLHIWLTGVLGILAASCSQVIDDPVTGDCVMEKEKVMIRFTIALDSPKVASRTWDGYDYEDEDKLGEIGSIKENSINNVYALLYDLNGVLMGQLDVIEVKPKAVDDEEDNKNKHIHTVLGSIEMDADKITNMSFKLMTLANCTLPASANLNNLETLTFTNPNTSDGSNIPMWGIATYKGVNLSGTTQGNPYDLTLNKKTPVYMLRSMAKIEVTLDSSMTGYTLEGATLSKAMNSGYVLPTLKDATGAAKTLANLTATTQLGVDEVFHPVEETTSNITSGASFTANTCVIYVPEYDNTAEDLIIHLTGLKKDNNDVYKDATQKTSYSFKHGKYNDKTGMFESKLNVTRNHNYKYKVKLNEGSQLLLTCEVQPWNDDREILDYTQFVSFVGDEITVKKGNETSEDDIVSVYMETEEINTDYKVKVADLAFTLQTPVGYTWYASLITDDEGKAYGFAQRDEDGNLVLAGDGKVATTATASGNVGTSATLTIVSEHTGLIEAIRSRLQIVVRNDNTGHTYVVKPNVMGGTYYIVQNP